MENGIKVINSNYIIVAGGAGYVGRYFVNYLLRNYENKRIVIVTRNLSKKMFFRDERVEYVKGFDELKIQDCDIYNFVYTNSSSFHYGPKLAIHYIDSMVNALGSKFGGTIFHISSIAVYNALRKPNYQKPAKLVGIKKNDPYSYTKAITENYLLKKAQKKNIQVKILRIGNVIGPGSIWIKKPLKRLQTGLPIIADSPHCSNTTFVGNLSYIIDRLAINKKDEIFYNICEFGNVSWEQWVTPLAELLDETPVKWSEDNLVDLKYGIKEDVRFLRTKVYNSIIPNIMKLTALNPSILKLLSRRDIDKSRKNAKQKVRSTSKQAYLELQEFKMAAIYLENREMGLEGVDDTIANSLPYSFEEVVQILKQYVRYNID